MKKVCYSCETAPSEFKLLKNEQYPSPFIDTYFWHIVNFTEDMDKYKVIHQIEQMISVWQRAMDQIKPVGSYLHFASTDRIEEADFILSFGPRKHRIYNTDGSAACPFDFDGNEGVLAHAWSLISSKPFGGQMHFDEDEQWSSMHKFTDNGMEVDLFTVGLHEFGHLLNLDHSEDPRAIMSGGYTGSKRSVAPDDCAGLQSVFGKIKQEIKDKYYPAKQLPEFPVEKEAPEEAEVEPTPKIKMTWMEILRLLFSR